MILTRYAEEEDAESLLELLHHELDGREFVLKDGGAQVREDLSDESSPCRWLVLEEDEQMVSL